MTPQRMNAALPVCALQFASSCLYLQGPAFAADFTGHIDSVLNGDTIEVLHNHHAERIRLNGIDCPEKGQAYGKRIIPGRPYKQKGELMGSGHNFSDHLGQDQGSDYCQTEVVIRSRG